MKVWSRARGDGRGLRQSDRSRELGPGPEAAPRVRLPAPAAQEKEPLDCHDSYGCAHAQADRGAVIAAAMIADRCRAAVVQRHAAYDQGDHGGQQEPAQGVAP